EDEIVVRKLSFNFTMRDADLSSKRLDVRNFCFDEVDSSVQHRAPQVARNVILLAHAKTPSHQRRIKHKLPAARHQRDLVCVADLSRETLGGCHAAGPA